jgi:hypothetical protein
LRSRSDPGRPFAFASGCGATDLCGCVKPKCTEHFGDGAVGATGSGNLDVASLRKTPQRQGTP